MPNTQYIEEYLEGRLNSQEKEVFETRLKNEPGFAAEYEKHLVAYALVQSNGAFRTKEILRRHEEMKYKKSKIRLLKPILSVAAVILLVISMWFLFPSKKPVSDERLFAEYFTPYRDPVAVRSDVASDDTRWKANNAYRSQDFTTAMSYYSQISFSTPVDRFYYGLSALQSSDVALAISLLGEVGESKSDYKEQALWYLALANIKAGNKNDAIKVLVRIVNENSYKKGDAEKLLKKME